MEQKETQAKITTDNFKRIYELEKYAQLVAGDEEERATLDSLLRLTITRFFRNSWLWSELGSFIQQAQGNLGAEETLRIWSAARVPPPRSTPLPR